MDGWKVAELSLVTAGQLDMLAALFKQCEDSKLWPEKLRRGVICMIPKGEIKEAKPTEMRPITVLATLWRVYAKIRAQQPLHWISTWACEANRGGMRGTCVQNTTVTMTLKL